MNTIPDFLIEMSHQMNEQDSRCTSHPYWQVRCKRQYPTDDEWSDTWVLYDDDGEFYHSDRGSNEDLIDYFNENHPAWLKDTLETLGIDESVFADEFDFSYGETPCNIVKCYIQDIEEVISTHFTEADAEWFIKRKQHDYPPLYTFVASAYWSPQIKQLQDWIKSLTENEK